MLRVRINVSFKMVPNFPKFAGPSPSYSESTVFFMIFMFFFTTSEA